MSYGQISCVQLAMSETDDRARALWERRMGLDQDTISRSEDASTDASRKASSVVDPETRRAVRFFLERIGARYAVQDVLLFGSRARRTHRPDSDADLAIVLEGERGDRYGTAGDMAGVAFDVLMETGVLIDPMPLWEVELLEPEHFSNPSLIDNITRDSVRLR